MISHTHDLPQITSAATNLLHQLVASDNRTVRFDGRWEPQPARFNVPIDGADEQPTQTIHVLKPELVLELIGAGLIFAKPQRVGDQLLLESAADDPELDDEQEALITFEPPIGFDPDDVGPLTLVPSAAAKRFVASLAAV